MNQKVKSHKYLFILAAMVLVLVSTTSFAFAQEGGERGSGEVERGGSIVPGGPGFVSIAGVTFTPVNDYTTFYSDAVFELYNPSTTDHGIYFAPVSLPQGATVTKFVIYFYDDVTGPDTIFGYLSRKPLAGGGFDYLAGAISDDVTSGYSNRRDETINYEVIDLQSYAYFVHVYIPESHGINLRLVGVRIDYEYPGYLPLVNK